MYKFTFAKSTYYYYLDRERTQRHSDLYRSMILYFIVEDSCRRNLRNVNPVYGYATLPPQIVRLITRRVFFFFVYE